MDDNFRKSRVLPDKLVAMVTRKPKITFCDTP